MKYACLFQMLSNNLSNNQDISFWGELFTRDWIYDTVNYFFWGNNCFPTVSRSYAGHL